MEELRKLKTSILLNLIQLDVYICFLRYLVNSYLSNHFVFIFKSNYYTFSTDATSEMAV
jgi:hypothetical protein